MYGLEDAGALSSAPERAWLLRSLLVDPRLRKRRLQLSLEIQFAKSSMLEMLVALAADQTLTWLSQLFVQVSEMG